MAKKSTYGGDRASARRFGFDAADATTAVQSAIDCGAAASEVPYLSGAEWLVQPLTMTSDHYHYLQGSLVKAHTSGYGATNKNVYSAHRIDNFGLIGSGEAVVEMRRESLSVDNTGPHCLNIRGSTHGRIEGVTFKNGSGDGMYIGPATSGGPRTPCEDIRVLRCHCYGNRRQGISITAGRRITVQDCILEATEGAAPQAGIDVEPPDGSDPMVDIVVRRCLARNNDQTGFIVSCAEQDVDSEEVSVLFEECRAVGGNFGIRAVRFNTDDVGPLGTIEYRDCIIQNTAWQGIWPNWDVSSAMTVKFTRCIVYGPTRSDKVPIFMDLHAENTPAATGGIVFDNCWVIDTLDRAPIDMALNDGLEDPDLRVTGTIYVVNPALSLGAYTDHGVAGLTVTVVPAFIPPR